jgi:sugar phosphate permease
MRGTWQTTGGGGSGGLGVAVIVALVLIGSGALTAILHAVAVLLIAAAVAIPVTAVSIIALAAHRTRPERPGQPSGPAWVSREPPATRPQLEGSHKQAAPQATPPTAIVNHYRGPSFHIYGDSGEQAAARIIRQALTPEPPEGNDR